MVLADIDHEKWSFGLDRIKLALERLGHPERSYKTVLVGGTNGKGSTCIFLERILTTAGLSVGVNISPHVSRSLERFRLDGRSASTEEMAGIEQELKPLLKDTSLTYFEWCVVLASTLFERHKVDVGIFEIGLGGRLDAANAIEPDISLITDVSIDHVDYLGKTIEAIAAEKAAITRPEKPLLTSAKGKALHVIKGYAAQVNAFLQEIDVPLEHKVLNGEHQAMNAALAMRAGEILGVTLSKDEQSYVLNTAFLPGRIESIGSHHRRIILDVAHNPSSMLCLIKYLNEIKFKGIVVLGILADKDYETMVRQLTDVVDCIFMAPVKSERSWKIHHMTKAGVPRKSVIFESIHEAFDAALSAEKDVAVTGSFYTVGEVRDRIVCQG